MVHEATYATIPPFGWQARQAPPVYRHEVMRRFWVDGWGEPPAADAAPPRRMSPAVVWLRRYAVGGKVLVDAFALNGGLLLALAGLPFILWRDPWTRWAVAALAIGHRRHPARLVDAGPLRRAAGPSLLSRRRDVAARTGAPRGWTGHRRRSRRYSACWPSRSSTGVSSGGMGKRPAGGSRGAPRWSNRWPRRASRPWSWSGTSHAIQCSRSGSTTTRTSMRQRSSGRARWIRHRTSGCSPTSRIGASGCSKPTCRRGGWCRRATAELKDAEGDAA